MTNQTSTGLPTFEQMRRTAHRMLGDAVARALGVTVGGGGGGAR